MSMAAWRKVLVIAAFFVIVFAVLLCFAAGSDPALGLEVASKPDSPGPEALAPFDIGLRKHVDLTCELALLEPTPAPAPDDYEPDDAKHQASRITIGEPQGHNFQRLDEDWVKFWAWGGHTYTITTLGLDIGCDPVLCLYDDVGSEMKCDDNAGEEELAAWMEWTPDESGIYFVKAAQNEPYVYGNLQYFLVITEVFKCRDSYEPDDTPADAKLLTEEPRTFHGPCGGDEDWAWFEAEGGEVYAIWTSGLEGGNDTVLALYETDSLTDTDIITLTVSDDYTDGIPNSRIVWQAPVNADESTYLVRVSPFEPGVGGCDVEYVLHLDKLSATPTPTPTPVPPLPDCEPDGYELDDAMHQANRINVNSDVPQEHAFHSYQDQDWVKFWAWEGYTYTIRTDVGPGTNTTLQLRNPEGDVVEENNNDPRNRPASRIDWTASDTGSYYVRVSTPYLDDTRLRGMASPYCLPYSVVVREKIPCSDDYEPDDGSDEGTTVEVDGDPQRHCFCVPCYDRNRQPDAADWVTFEAEAGTTYDIRTFDLTGGNDTLLRLYDDKDSLLSENDDYEEDSLASSILWHATADGMYHVEALPFDPRMGGADVCYNLRVNTVTWFSHLPLVVGPPACLDNHEPDDDRDESEDWPPLKSDESVTGYICRGHIQLETSDPVERDWYWFDIGSLREIEVDLEVPGGVDYDLYLWVGHWQGSENPTRGADEHISWSSERIGRYYVVVKSNGDYDNQNPYHLRLTLE